MPSYKKRYNADTKTNLQLVSAIRNVGKLASLVFLLTFMGLSQSISAQNEKPTIEWVMLDWPPAWIFEGELKGEGYAGKLQDYFISLLPQYQHKTFVGNFPRLYPITARENVCFAASFYEWTGEDGNLRDDIIWSEPTVLFFYHGLMSRIDQDIPSPPSLERIIQDPTLRLGIDPKRTYGAKLDPIIRRSLAKPHVTSRPTTKLPSEGFFNMLLANRIDYFIEYYPMLKYRELTKGITGQFKHTILTEHASEVGLASISCGNSVFGAKVIKEINDILEEVKHTEFFKRISSDWFMRPENEKEFNRLWQSEIINRKK